MARTSATTTTGAETKKATPAVDKEKEALKAKLAENEKRMSEILEQMAQLQSMLQNKPQEVSAKPKSDKRIKFINMTTGGFTISGTRLYHLDKQFDSRIVSEAEARVIVNNMPQSIAAGLLYIADHDFVKDCELDYVYETLLDDKTLKNLLNENAEDVCEIYQNACDEQKAIITDMVENKRLNGELIDANIVVRLGQLCGKDFMKIEPDEG